MSQNDRAAAWYELRYRELPANPQPGHSLRNYRDAELFGLYDNQGAATLDEAQAVYRMYTAGRSVIRDYETRYPAPSNVSTLITALNPAYQTLFADLAARHPDEMSGLSAASFSPVDLLIDAGESGTLPAANLLDATEYNADGSERVARNLIVGDKGFNILLKGGAGDDVLIAGDGNDILEGGADNDRLYGGKGTDQLSGGDGDDTLDGRDNAGGDLLDGGEGADTYYADEGDTIRDSDGKGTVFLNGKKLSFALKKKGNDYYLDGAGNEYRLVNGNLEVGDPLVIEGFDNGELGIYLDEEEDPDDPDDPDGSNNSTKAPGYNPNNAKRWIDPLVLDLNGDGKISTVASGTSNAYFDFNNDGIAEKSGWIAGGDGLLTLDDNGNGVVDGLSELFGTATLDGFSDLKSLDHNSDGHIDTDDPDYVKLKVWQDVNGDGISQTGELKSLADQGIERIELNATPGQALDAGNLVGATATYRQRDENGEVRDHLVADVQFAVNFSLTDSNPNRPLGQAPNLDGGVFQLPWLRGYGNVKSLHIAYQENPRLRQAVIRVETFDGAG